MIDDDFVLHGSNVVEIVLSYAAPKTYSCWYGKVFQKQGDYWNNSLLTMTDLKQQNRKNCSTFHYCGTGLSVIDADIFQDELLFQLPNQFLYVEDLWLSAVAWRRGYLLKRIFANISIRQPKGEFELWKVAGIHHVKNAFLSELRSSWGFAGSELCTDPKSG